MRKRKALKSTNENHCLFLFFMTIRWISLKYLKVKRRMKLLCIMILCFLSLSK